MSSETAKIDYVNPAVESRTTRLPVELRSGGAQSRTIGGYAAVFGRRSQPLRGFVEQVGRGFFNKSKGDGWPDVVCRFNQQDEYILGATRSGTLRLGIDATGLDYAVDLPECRGDVLEVVTRGDVGHSSFAFQTYQDEWGFADGHPLRTLLSGRLIDVAPVPSPAYLDTTVGLRSLARYVGAPIEKSSCTPSAASCVNSLCAPILTVVSRPSLFSARQRGCGSSASVGETRPTSPRGGRRRRCPAFRPEQKLCASATRRKSLRERENIVTRPFEILSLEWFDYEVRAAALRLLSAGADDIFYQRLDETMAHPRLREILHCVALFGYGAVWRHFNGVTPLVREVMARELGVAEGLQNLVADDLHNPEDT